jgi:hypothetical protein
MYGYLITLLSLLRLMISLLLIYCGAYLVNMLFKIFIPKEDFIATSDI